MSDSGITISGGGTRAVNTPAMQQAASVLGDATSRLAVLWNRLQALRSVVPIGTPADGALGEAQNHLSAARAFTEHSASGLALAAQRYGAVEEAATSAFRDLVALRAGALGTVVGDVRRAGGPDLDPVLVGVLATEAAAALAAAWVTAPIREPLRPFDPFADPMLVGAEDRGIASVDDVLRGLHGRETLADALGTDPRAPDSTQRIAARSARTYRDAPGLHVAVNGGVLQETPSPARLAAPRDLAGVGALVPDDGDGRAQVRITEVDGADGVRRWIVAVAGTTSFSTSGTDQVFDMRSNLQGVGGVPMDAELTTERSMREAGVQPGDPVLVVGHSQGALVAMRLAQSGRFDVQGVVTLGGPTRPIVAPASVRVLAVEHTDDTIPATGGAAPDGPGPANRIVVRRTVYQTEFPRAVADHTFLMPAHLPSNYVDTLADVDRSADPRVIAFRARVQPFLTGTAGSDRLYLATRGAPAEPGDTRAPSLRR